MRLLYEARHHGTERRTVQVMGEYPEDAPDFPTVAAALAWLYANGETEVAIPVHGGLAFYTIVRRTGAGLPWADPTAWAGPFGRELHGNPAVGLGLEPKAGPSGPRAWPLPFLEEPLEDLEKDWSDRGE